MTGSFSSGATASLVAKNGTRKLSQVFENRFWCSRGLNDHIKVPNMIGSFASSATAIWWPKMELKILPQKSKISKISKNPKLELKIYWGPLALSRAHRVLQARRAPSPPQDLKERAHSALKLLRNFCVTLHFNTISSMKEILVTTFFYSRSSYLFIHN